MAFELPPLPYEKNALEPHISRETIDFHYGKHHSGYVAKLNDGVKGTEYENASLENIIKKAKGAVYNNAAQVWNHTFYWNCLSPVDSANKNEDRLPIGDIKGQIEKKWSSFDKFKEEFQNKAAGNFGSGWTWLVINSANELEIVNTDDAVNPITNGQKPLLTCDVWEHAYYIDYRNARPDYLKNFFKLINWEFVNTQLK